VSYEPAFRLRFDLLDLRSRQSALVHLVEGLAAANAGHLQLHPRVPWLYESGVTYAEDPEGHECWTDIPETLSRGTGDCKDLVAWRLAEIRVREREEAFPVVTFARAGARVKFHIAVRRADGRVEDPSRELGMR
jgi:hypothetical protein